MHVAQNHWYAVLSSAELGTRPLRRRRFGQVLVFWRDGRGGIGVAADRCPHRRAALSGGRVRDGCIECPFHGLRFDVAGRCRALPVHPEHPIPRALGLKVLHAREQHGYVWLWTGPDPAPEAPIPFFDTTGFSYAGSESLVGADLHYTVAVENQLDFAHLPFIHRRTIGRKLPPGPCEVTTVVEGDCIRAWDQYQSAIVELLAPNIWRLQFGAIWQQLAFVPVDEGHTLHYVRAYQNQLTWPGLAWLYGRSGRFFNRLILGEDLRVTQTIPAGETRLRGMGEVLLPSDAPIIAYRRWREQHRGPFAPAFAPAFAPGVVGAESPDESAPPRPATTTTPAR